MSRNIGKCMLLATLALALVLGSARAGGDDADDEYVPAADSQVVVLTSENFKYRTAEGHWLIKFYAPWCGHCKHLAPVWDEASTLLAGTVSVGKIDCTVHSDVCNAYGVRGYPTLKYFRSGAARDYRGGRTAAALTEYGRRVSGPAVGEVTAATLKKFLAGSGSKFVYFSSGSVREDEVMMNVAERFVDAASFAMAVDASLAGQYQVTARPALVAVRGDSKEDVESFSGDWEPAEVASWTGARLLPLLAELTTSNAGDYMASELQTVLTLVDPASASAKTRALKVARDVAVLLQGKFNFAWVDGVRLADFAEQFELAAADLPQTVVWNSRDALYYNDKKALTKGEILAFLDSVLAGEVEAKGEGRGFVADTLRWLENFVTTVSPLTMVLLILGSFAACGGCIYCVLTDSPEEVVAPPSTLPEAHAAARGKPVEATPAAPASPAEKKRQ